MLFTEFDKRYSYLQTNTLREFLQYRKQTVVLYRKELLYWGDDPKSGY
jgi:hypothetical protein